MPSENDLEIEFSAQLSCPQPGPHLFGRLEEVEPKAVKRSRARFTMHTAHAPEAFSWHAHLLFCTFYSSQLHS